MKLAGIPSYNLDCKRKQNLAFEGGLSSRVYSKLTKSGVSMLDITNEAERINNINHPNVSIVDAVYDFKEKAGKFLFSLTHKSYIDSLEDVEPGYAIVKGEDLWDALKNLDRKSIVKGNNDYIIKYKKMDSERQIKLQEMRAKQKAFNEELKERFENDNSFWSKYYRDLAISQKNNTLIAK